MQDKSLKQNIIVVIVFALIIGGFFLVRNYLDNREEKADEFLKDYKVNEYIATYISDETMASIYLNDYINTMYSNVEEAYNLLDEEYRTKKFGSLENYRSYVNSLDYTSYNLTRYYKTTSNGYVVFGVYDQNGNFFAFRTSGVMQYSVFLDDYTMEI